jgi:hypothetical protein
MQPRPSWAKAVVGYTLLAMDLQDGIGLVDHCGVSARQRHLPLALGIRYNA